MKDFEKEKQFWKDFIDLNKKGIVDTVIRLTINDKQKLEYLSYKENGKFSVYHNLESFFNSNIENAKIHGLELNIVYLPFSVEPLHIISKITAQQVIELSQFDINIFESAFNACFKELSGNITEKYEKLAYSNGYTYRTPDHLFDGNWNETLKK